MIFLLILLICISIETFISFIIRTYAYQQTIDSLYLKTRKQEELAFAACLHVAKIVSTNENQKNNEMTPTIIFQPIIFSNDQTMHLSAEIKKHDRQYEILITIHSNNEKDITYRGIVISDSQEYFIKNFERIYY